MDLMLDPDTWDLAIVGGTVPLVKKSDAIRQNATQRLKIYQGEFFLDLTEGTPFYQSILGKRVDIFLIDQILQERIIDTPGIISLDEFELDYDASLRRLRVSSFKARAFDGVVDFGSIDLSKLPAQEEK